MLPKDVKIIQLVPFTEEEKLPAVLTVEMIEEAAKKAAGQSGAYKIVNYVPPELVDIKDQEEK